MTDRYSRRSARSRSPPVFNPARVSLPINISGQPASDTHVHAVPTPRREAVNNSNRSSSATANSNTSTITTTYKIKTEPSRSSSARESGRVRRSTVDSHSRPITVTVTPSHRPSAHPTNTTRSDSIHWSGDEDYTGISTSSRYGYHHSRERQTSHVEPAEVRGSESDRDGIRPRIVPPRETLYANSRLQPVYNTSAVRHPDTVADDYGEDGYGYTNPRDLVQYDLDHTYQRHEVDRTSSEKGRKQRPNSISAYGELMPQKPHESRERGPPPSTRGFGKIRLETIEKFQSRGIPTTVRPPMESSNRPVNLLQSDMSSQHRTPPFYERETRAGLRDDSYEPREIHPRERTYHDRYDETIEKKTSGGRTERPEPSERSERAERIDRAESEHKEHREYRGRDVIATGLGIAGAALGINAVRNASRDETRHREEDRRRKDSKDTSRRQKDWSNTESADTSSRDSKEHRTRHDDTSPRNVKSTRETNSRERDDKEARVRAVDYVDQNGRQQKERKNTTEERDVEVERRDSRRHRAKPSPPGGSGSDDTTSRGRRERLKKENHNVSSVGFNPKDTTDIKAVKQALCSKAAESKAASTRSSKDPRDTTEIRITIVNEREREERERECESTTLAENKPPRVVSPPREKVEEKPVKGILRPPREKFPEDPAPIREGVAPLKDTKKEGIPADARWTKISRRLVNPEALEAGKERFEARDDFVIVLRVLSKEEVQKYADLTQKIRASHEEEDLQISQQHAARKLRRENHKSERTNSREPRRHHQARDAHSDSDNSMANEDDTGDWTKDRPQLYEGSSRKKYNLPIPVVSDGMSDLSKNSSRLGLEPDGLQDARMLGPPYPTYTRGPLLTIPAPVPMPHTYYG
ncbi:zinc finger protein DHHC domain containing protein [Blumeria hordei DH14]|uniref:Zinc finger protein DHHC domain containing protein n=1 Tax=Blumeria graminis f. sp. hordei (strain DH14) TaxID=546991 RepID=N1JI84_BLUG1|nr:zinc finger protein DHHC domain containing protein [Blumeria hordei DH14]